MVSRVAFLEAAISTLEERVFAPICNCRIATAFHNADCLQAILKAQCIPCPAHGFRFLGIFFPVQPTEPVLPSDRRFCRCISVDQSDTKNSWESDFESSKRDCRVQTRLVRQYLELPGTKYRMEFAHAAILSNARTEENGRPDLRSFTPEALEALELALDYHRKREKWMADAGQPLPTSLEILKLQHSRLYRNAGTL
jgi:hypothetical protein